MSTNTFLSSENFNNLLLELAIKYNLEKFELKEIIVSVLSKIYGFQRVIINENGSISGIKYNTNFKYEQKYYNISKKKQKEFQQKLHNELFKHSTKKIESKFNELLKDINRIIYAKSDEVTDVKHLKLYNKHNTQIKNFYAEIEPGTLFKNDDLKKGIILYIPKREKANFINGKFYIKSLRKHPSIVRLYINKIFKSIKDSIGKSYSYEKVVIDLKNKKVTIFLNLLFSDAVKSFFEKSLNKLDDFEVIYIVSKQNKFKKGKL